MTDRVTHRSSPPADQDVLDQVVRRLVDVAQPERIILFGSRARGDSSPDSDLDLVVIEKEAPDRAAEMVRLRRALAEILLPIDVLVYSARDVEERGHWLGTPLHEALSEGRVLYARG